MLYELSDLRNMLSSSFKLRLKQNAWVWLTLERCEPSSIFLTEIKESLSKDLQTVLSNYWA